MYYFVKPKGIELLSKIFTDIKFTNVLICKAKSKPDEEMCLSGINIDFDYVINECYGMELYPHLINFKDIYLEMGLTHQKLRFLDMKNNFYKYISYYGPNKRPVVLPSIFYGVEAYWHQGRRYKL